MLSPCQCGQKSTLSIEAESLGFEACLASPSSPCPPPPLSLLFQYGQGCCMHCQCTLSLTQHSCHESSPCSPCYMWPFANYGTSSVAGSQFWGRESLLSNTYCSSSLYCEAKKKEQILSRFSSSLFQMVKRNKPTKCNMSPVTILSYHFGPC